MTEALRSGSRRRAVTTARRSGQPDRYGRARAAIREEFALVGGKRGYRYIRQRLREQGGPDSRVGQDRAAPHGRERAAA
ncbi:MAG: hypothetical protein ACLTSX_01210 [Collinsella sp.]